ncbi:cob(I)yrinic acid a,c-diamide adenosyltransferase [Sphingorhabdus soli]|uniref:Corrinoid adenosyltransferase n=1 Tax=Flavisphingopyxis soli TaxID=2601267 RepID=A0A5C6URK2_9SPHN|nr:cob(I)yrinic acid a,c-diamide adenosyltransferase [Sphingorhabdus soli]TXC73528.1 cob(I)yrinic acid a,c-diamide adenosyltransferase [Sphingorhabdus soli]
MVKLNKIYTRTGDAGTTGLVDGSRTSKSDPLIAAVGDVDEANSAIGVAIVALGDGPNAALGAQLTVIQNDLFDLGADLATPASDADGTDFTPSEMVLRVTAAQVARLEREIDAMNEDLAPLRSFILPGGTPAAAALHLARAITRRAERSAVAAGEARALNPAALAYLNRLSDHLFVMTRLVNARADGDVLWVPGASR